MMELLAKARRSLSRRDPVLRRIIRQVGPCLLEQEEDHFRSLLSAIVAQQISSKAARTIFSRLEQDVCRGKLIPTRIVRASDEELRAAGLSRSKQKAVRDLAQRVAARTLKPSLLPGLSDEEVIAQLLPVHGIGRWTAQMFLIFSLGRLDVLPVADLGLQAAVRNEYELEELPSAGILEELGAPWKPYRSVATWYLWRSLG